MPSTVAPSVTTVLRCRAPHPLADRFPHKFGNRMHNARLLEVGFAAEPTGRILKREDAVRPGMIPALCKCGSVTEYRVVWPRHIDPDTLP